MIGSKKEVMNWILDQQNDLYEIKPYRPKRSNKANSYFWELIGKYAFEKGVDPVEEYRERIKRLGIFRQFDPKTTELNTFKKVWGDMGLGWFCDVVDTFYEGEVERKLVNAYYGSSSYNSKQMARLIEDLVEDCQDVGIETKPKEEIDSLLKSC